MDIKKWLNNLRVGAKNDRALIIVGGEGSGKTTAAKLVTKLSKIDERARNVHSHQFGEMFFLSHFYSSPLLIVEVVPGDYSFAFLTEHMKPLISNRQVQVDRIGKPTLTVDNNMNFILLMQAGVALEEHQRRYLVATPFEVINAAIEVF